MRIADLAQRPSDGRPAACSRPDGLRQEGVSIRMGWGGSEFFLAESQSRLYPHMRAKFGRDPTAVSKKVPLNFISRYVGFTCLL